MAPSEIAFGKLPVPRKISREEIKEIVRLYCAAAERALRADFDVVEIHAAHGYLIHSFLSPITNKRQDEYGGSFENRIRFLIEAVTAIREVWPDTRPLFFKDIIT